MPIETTVYKCSVTGKLFAEKEEAELSEKLVPRVRQWIVSAQQRVMASHEQVEKRVNEFFQKVFRDNGIEHPLITAKATPRGVTLIPHPEQSELTALLLDTFAEFALEAYGGGFTVPVSAAENVMLEITEYFSKTGVYEEKANDEI